MATVQKYLPFDVSSDANFDAIGNGIYDAFVSTCGWTEKADTGRTDWTTNPARPAAGFYLWNIFGPSDALQTGSTVYYAKVEVGLDASSRPQIKITIGTGTNGSGTLTNPSTTRWMPLSGVVNAGNATYECSFSGDTGRFGCLLWRNSGINAVMAFGIERTLASDGTPSSDGVTLVAAMYASSVGSGNQQSISFTAGVGPALTSRIISPIPLLATTLGFNNKLPRGLLLPLLGVLMNPMTIFGNCTGADAAEGALLQFMVYGATRTYMATKAGALGAFSTEAAATAGNFLLMRYD